MLAMYPSGLGGAKEKWETIGIILPALQKPSGTDAADSIAEAMGRRDDGHLSITHVTRFSNACLA